MAAPIFVVIFFFFTLSLFSVALRLYSRWLMKAGIGWDDGLIIVAMACCVALFGLSCYCMYSCHPLFQKRFGITNGLSV